MVQYDKHWEHSSAFNRPNWWWGKASGNIQNMSKIYDPVHIQESGRLLDTAEKWINWRAL